MNMKIQLLFSFILAISLIQGVHSTVFTIKNSCPYNIAPATYTNPRSKHSVPTGFELAPNASKNIDIPIPWVGYVWARSECSNHSGNFHCNTGDCGSNEVECHGANATSPISQIVFIIGDTEDRKDTYSLSLLDGFNLPISIVPQGDCETLDCPVDINDKCPPELAIKGGSGKTIGCKGACLAFNKPVYCCPRDYPDEKCMPTQYSRFFKKLCPKSLTYPDDTSNVTYTCNTGANYVITFCP